MPTPAIIERVRDLQRELAETPDAARASHPEVPAIEQQIETIMLDPSQVHLYTSLNDRLLKAYVAFEIDHPKLARAMIDVATALGNAGL